MEYTDCREIEVEAVHARVSPEHGEVYSGVGERYGYSAGTWLTVGVVVAAGMG